MICAIHQPHYLPWLRYIDKVARADVFVLLDDVQYSKNGWQNRNRIKGPGGPFLLTVPVHVRHPAELREVKVAGDGWRRRHLESLRTSYGRAPGFALAWAAVAPALEETRDDLVALNRDLLERLLAALGIRTRCLLSSEIGAAGEASDRLVSLCRKVGAREYLSGAHAIGAYLDPEPFRLAGIGLLVHHWTAPHYRQVHPAAGFAADLSIVDLLAAEPEDAAALLATSGRVEHHGAGG